MSNRWDARIFFCHLPQFLITTNNISGFNALEHIFFEIYPQYLLLHLSRISYIKFCSVSCLVINVFLLFFQMKLINFVFFVNHCFQFVIQPRRLPITIKILIAWGMKLVIILSLFALVTKSSFPAELGYVPYLDSARRLFYMEVDRVFSS